MKTCRRNGISAAIKLAVVLSFVSIMPWTTTAHLTFVHSLAPVTQTIIDPQAFTGNYILYNTDSNTNLGTFNGMQSLNLISGNYALDNYNQVGGSYFNFSVDQFGQVSGITNPIAAQAIGTTLRLNNTTIAIDPGAYAGRYSFPNVSSFHTGPQSFVVVPGLRYGVDNGTACGSAAAQSYFYFEVGSGGAVTNIDVAPAAYGSGNTLHFNNQTLNVDPNGYAGTYNISSYHTVAPQVTGSHSFVLIPGLLYAFDKGTGTFESTFKLAAGGTPTNIQPVSLGTGVGNTLVLTGAPPPPVSAASIQRWSVTNGFYALNIFGDGTILAASDNFVSGPGSGVKLNPSNGSTIAPFSPPDVRTSIRLSTGDQDYVVGGYENRSEVRQDNSFVRSLLPLGCCNIPRYPMALDATRDVGYVQANGALFFTDLSTGNWNYMYGAIDTFGMISLADPETLYLAGQQGDITRMHPDSGHQWHVDLGRHNFQPGAVAADGGFVVSSGLPHFHGSPETGILAHVTANGDVPWNHDVNAVTPPVIGSNGLVFVGTQAAPINVNGSGAIEAYDLNTGSLVWRTAVQGLPNDLLVGDDGAVYAGTGSFSNGRVYVLGQSDGAIRQTITDVPGAWEIILRAGLLYASGQSITALPVEAVNYDLNSPWPVRFHDNQRTSNRQAPILTPARDQNGLVSWWQAENNAFDSIGGNNGTPVNNPAFTAGHSGQGFSFDGMGQYVTIPNSTSLNPAQGITVDAWIKLDALPPAGSTDGWDVVTKDNPVSGPYVLRVRNDGSVSFYIWTIPGSSAATEIRSAPCKVSVGNFAHVAGTYDAVSGLVSVYVNGEKYSTVASPTGAINSNGNALKIGADLYNLRFFNGVIDEVHLWDRALSDSELQQVYGGGATTGPCDSIAPSTTINANPSANLPGWNNSDVNLSLSASDNAGGSVRSITYNTTGAQLTPPTVVNGATASLTINAEGQTTVSYFATDNAGNVESEHTLIIRIDKTAPSVVCGQADTSWHATDVSIACVSSDSRSGLVNSADASFALATTVAAGTETGNAATNSHTVCDIAGNCSTAGPINGNKVDKKAPTITISTPSVGAAYLLNQPVSASYFCTDGGSGVASCVGPVNSGSPINTASAGVRTFTVNAADSVGNQAPQVSVNYTVGYGINPLFDQTKAHKSGSTVPIKLKLVDALGQNVSNAGVVVHAVALIQVATSASEVINDAGNANPDGNFRYEGGSYIFNLKTTGLSTGTYRLEFVAGGDPSIHVVFFQVRQ